MSTETIAILRAISDQIEDTINRAKLTIAPKVISEEEHHDWRNPNRRTYEGPMEEDSKRKVYKHWPELVPLAALHTRVQRYMADVQGPQK